MKGIGTDTAESTDAASSRRSGWAWAAWPRSARATDAPAAVPAPPEDVARLLADADWPSLKHYDAAHLARIALPIGGIGTGTVSLGGRGDLRDFELMNRPAKGFVPTAAAAPFFAVRLREPGRPPVARVLEGPLPADELEGSHGSPAPNAGLPRFRVGRLRRRLPVRPGAPHRPRPARRGAPQGHEPPRARGRGGERASDRGLPRRAAQPLGAARRGDRLRVAPELRGHGRLEDEEGLEGRPAGPRGRLEPQRRSGAPPPRRGSSSRRRRWTRRTRRGGRSPSSRRRTPWSRPARAGPREAGRARSSISGTTSWPTGASTSARQAPRTPRWPRSRSRSISPPARRARPLFLLAWHFPNRTSWTPKSDPPGPEDWVGNHYATQFADAWDVAEKTLPRLPDLHRRTVAFVSAFAGSDLPAEVKEAALFNLSTLRTQTCFRTADGRFYGWEGCADTAGCCHGSCTHVWNYEQATPFLFGSLSLAMREVEFGHATERRRA